MQQLRYRSVTCFTNSQFVFTLVIIFRLHKGDGVAGNAYSVDSFKSVIIQEWGSLVTLATTTNKQLTKEMKQFPNKIDLHIIKPLQNTQRLSADHAAQSARTFQVALKRTTVFLKWLKKPSDTPYCFAHDEECATCNLKWGEISFKFPFYVSHSST